MEFLNLVRLLLAVTIAVPCAVATEVEPPSISTRVDRLIRSSRVRRDELGIVIQWQHAGRSSSLFELNQDKPFILASVSKFLTGAAVLEGLGPGFKFVTEIRGNEVDQNGVLKGDIFLIGGGDPGFVSESMWFLVNELKRTRIKTVEGGIVVDESRFDQVRLDPSRQNGRVDRAYDAPVGAMSFNWNSVNVYVRPGASGERAQVFLDPENSYTTLINQVKTRGSDKKKVLAAERLADDSAIGDRILVSGSIANNAEEAVIYKNITQPALWSGYQLKEFLLARGIEVRGGIRVGTVAKSTELLAKAESRPLSSLVTDMMKWSNNFVAEMLVKNLAAEKVGRPAKLEVGTAKIREQIVKWGLSEKHFQFVNPSGLTRDNRFRPRDFVNLMNIVARRFDFFPETLVSLPISGIDGTLKNRIKDQRARGRIRAKTGSINGVATMAGYAGREDGSSVTFAFFFNGRADHGEDARVLIDKMAAVLVE